MLNLTKKTKKKKKVTANLSLGGKVSQISGGSSVPKISAVPLRRRSLRGVSLPTSILSSHSRSSFTCLAPPAMDDLFVSGFYFLGRLNFWSRLYIYVSMSKASAFNILSPFFDCLTNNVMVL